MRGQRLRLPRRNALGTACAQALYARPVALEEVMPAGNIDVLRERDLNPVVAYGHDGRRASGEHQGDE